LVQALPVLVIVLLGFALRVYHLDGQSLWDDEGISLLRSSLPYHEMMRTLPAEHVPGYWLLLRAWLSITGTTDFALRYLSVLPSVLVIAIGYRLAADLGSHRTGLVAALLLATNSFQIWYAQEARMYSWLVAAGMGSTWVLWRLLGARKPVPLLVGYILLVSAAINLHFYGFLIPLAHTVFVMIWLFYVRDVRVFLRWLVASAMVLVLYLPWWPRLFQARGFKGCCPAPEPALLPWRFLTAYTVGDSMPPPLQAALPWVYLLLILFGAYAWFRRDRLAGWLLVCAASVPMLSAFAIAVVTRDFYHERYAIVLSVPLLMLAAGALDVISPEFWRPRPRPKPVALRTPPGSWLAALMLAGLVGANLVALHRLYTDTTVQKTDFRAVARRIEESESPGDVIVVHGLDPEVIFMHYYQGQLPIHNVHPVRSRSDAEIATILSRLTEGARRVWMLHYDPPTTSIEYWLASHAWLADRSRYGDENLTLSVYGLPGLAQRDIPQEIAFGPELRLVDAVVVGEAGDGLDFRAGDLLGVTTVWDVLESPPRLNFSLRLRDAEGRTWLARDYVPLEGSAPTELWQAGARVEDRSGLLLPADLPVGSYEVFLVLYDASTGAALRVGEGDGASLASIQVSPAAVPPNPASLPISERVDKRLGDAFELLGFDITPQPLRPGQSATLTLWWRAVDHPLESYGVQVRVKEANGQPAAELTHPLSWASPDTWQLGQVVREFYPIQVAPGASTGTYRVTLSLVGADGRPRGEPLDLGAVAVKARPRVYRLPQVTHPMHVSLGDSMLLLGYDLTPPVTPGQDLDVTLYWQAKQRVPRGYKVFVHLVDDSGRTVVQADAIPGEGLAPTESWLPGEIVADRHELAAPVSGHYRLLVGIYDPVSGARLPALDGTGRRLQEDAIPLGELQLP
jgi:hypothetical protein